MEDIICLIAWYCDTLSPLKVHNHRENKVSLHAAPYKKLCRVLSSMDVSKRLFLPPNSWTSSHEQSLKKQRLHLSDNYLCACFKDMDLGCETLRDSDHTPLTKSMPACAFCATPVQPVGRAKHQLGDVVNRAVVIETPSKTYDIILVLMNSW